MTVCIAAIHKSDTIITACDRKVSFGGYTSAEKGMMKFVAVRPNWIGMIAGETSPAVPVFNRIASRHLTDDCLENFSASCTEAYKRELTAAGFFLGWPIFLNTWAASKIGSVLERSGIALLDGS